MNLLPFHTKPIRLIDGPLVDVSRAELVMRMRAVIVETGTAGDHDDAWLALRFAGFGIAEIVMTIDDARQAAAQDIVAREMSRP